MDAVRFGRALGFGARQAVKTLTTAVDAATAENPGARRTGGIGGAKSADVNGGRAEMRAAATQSAARPAVKAAAHTAARTIVGARNAQQGLKRSGRRFGEAVWGPFVRLSGVVWLEVSGVFFGIFALFAGAGVWRLRGAWHTVGSNGAATNAGAHRSFEGAVLMLAVFGYFCASSFGRARRRERGR